jgi:hypothetical protein
MVNFKFLQLALMVAAVLFGSTAFAQCLVDPITGQMKCHPIKKVLSTTAAVAGKTVSAVGAAITPDFVPLSVQYGQTYTTPVVSTGYSTSYSSGYSTGWSKSWSKVHGQPLRNVGRRLFGR